MTFPSTGVAPQLYGHFDGVTDDTPQTEQVVAMHFTLVYRASTSMVDRYPKQPDGENKVLVLLAITDFKKQLRLSIYWVSYMKDFKCQPEIIVWNTGKNTQ